MGFGVCPPTCYTSYLLVRTPQLFALNSCLDLGWTLGAPTRDVPRPALRSLRDLRALPTGRFRRCFMWRAQWRDALGVARQMARRSVSLLLSLCHPLIVRCVRPWPSAGGWQRHPAPRRRRSSSRARSRAARPPRRQERWQPERRQCDVRILSRSYMYVKTAQDTPYQPVAFVPLPVRNDQLPS